MTAHNIVIFSIFRLKCLSVDDLAFQAYCEWELSMAHSLHQLLWNFPDYLNHVAHLPRNR